MQVEFGKIPPFLKSYDQFCNRNKYRKIGIAGKYILTMPIFFRDCVSLSCTTKPMGAFCNDPDGVDVKVGSGKRTPCAPNVRQDAGGYDLKSLKK